MDLFAYCLILPSFNPLFIDNQSGLLNPSTSLSIRLELYALLMICYPLAQVLGAPFMGNLSDKLGRKKALTLTLMANVGGYGLATLALVFKQLPLMYIGFSLSGVTGGNIPVSQSAIADISTPENKSRNMSLVLASYGFCYILGALLGGNLVHTHSFAPYVLPFLLATIVSSANVIFSLLFFKETYLSHNDKTKSSILSFSELIKPLRSGHNLKLIIVIFLSFFAWNFLIKVIQVFLYDRFHYLAPENARVIALLGLWTVLTQALLLPYLSRLYSSTQFIKSSTLLLGLSLIALSFCKTPGSFYLFFSIAAISYSFILPCLTAILSNLNTQHSQGKVIGISQAIQSLAKTLTPMPSALLSALNPSYPLFISGAIFLLTFVLYTFIFKFRTLKLLPSAS